MKFKPYHSFNSKRFFLGLVGLMMLSWHVSAQDISSGLILHYTFDNITGTNIQDESATGNNGILQGNAIAVSGFSGDGIICNSKSDYILAPDNINAGLTSFTFSTWVKFTSLLNATRFFDWGSGVNGDNNFLSFIPSFNGDNQYMTLRYRPSSGTSYNVTSTERCPVGTWAHVAVTYNWNGSSGTATIYLNGSAVGSKSGLPYNIGSSLGNTSDNYFGYSRWPQDSNGLKGTFDDLRVYNRALSADDIVLLTGLQELYTQYDLLELGDLTALTSDINLPNTLGENGVTVSWSSSLSELIADDGTVTRPDYYNSDVTLTATVMLGSVTKTKVFNATVLVNESTAFESNLIVRYDFSNLDGKTVKDIAEKGFIGTLKNDAKVVTMGSVHSGIFNVLNLGSATGYFDMGSEMGKAVSRLNDYTVSTYFRIDDSYTDLSSNGNFLWNFSNSNNAVVNHNGYIFCRLKDQSVNITPEFYATGNQEVGYGKNALKGNWHNITFTQQGTTAIIYMDGVEIAKKNISNVPGNTLYKNGFTGTVYNWIGRSCYTSDVYLRNTLVYDFRIYNTALTQSEIKTSILNVDNTLFELERAYLENIDLIKTAETLVIETPDRPVPTYLEIVNHDNSIVRLKLNDISSFAASDSETVFDLSTGSETYSNDDISKLILSTNSTQLKNTGTNLKFKIYPNPATDIIYLSLPEIASKKIEIYSISGKLVSTEILESKEERINITQLPQGIYILKNGSQVEKFTKQ